MATSLRILGAQPLPKIQPGKLSKPPKPPSSMQNALQPLQPTQWELKSKPMNKNAQVYKLGSFKAYTQLGLQKTANIGIWQGLKGLGTAAQTGWSGISRGKALGSTGVGGSAQSVSNYWQHLAKRSPGTAAATAAIPAAVAAGGAGYAMGGNNNQ